MHPILANRRLLAAYAVAWAFTGLVVTGLLSGSHGTDPLMAAVVVPMVLVYGFVCLASWYLGRALPLEETDLLRIVVVGTSAALLSSAVWVLFGKLWAMGLSSLPAFASLEAFYAEIVPTLFALGIAFFVLATTVHYLLIAFQRSRDAERQVLRARLLAQDAELRALRAQIDPHFLFNSLNSISALTAKDPAAARQMCLLLSDFLRQSLTLGRRDWITLEEEFSLVRDFLAVEQARFGARLGVEIQAAPECRSIAIPPLLLQPLVENAVKHGIAGLVEGGTIAVMAEGTPSSVRISVRNPRDPQARHQGGTGLGLTNVRQRLQTLYGGDARLHFTESDRQVQVTVSLPAQVR